MAYYKCPDCIMTFSDRPQSPGLLKGHLISSHGRDDLAQLGQGEYPPEFKDYEISEETYNQLRADKAGRMEKPSAGSEKGGYIPPVRASVPESKSSPFSSINEYVTEPVERLKQVLLVNGGSTETVDRVCKVMALSPWLWGDYANLVETLVSHFGSTKRLWVQQCVSQYMRGVEIPSEMRGFFPFPNPNFNHYGPPQYPNWMNTQSTQGMYQPGAINPEVQELRERLRKLDEERQQEREQRLLDEIKSLREKVESGVQSNPILSRLEAIEKQISGSGQQSTMTIYDEKGNPMVLPYDRSLMAAITRKNEVEARAVETEQMMRLLMVRGTDDSKYVPLLEQLKKEQEAASRKVEELTKSLMDQKIEHLEERVKNAEEMAASNIGEGKSVLDYAQQAGDDLKDGIETVAKEVKSGLDHVTDRISDIVTSRPPTPKTVTTRTPQQIGDILEAENNFIRAIGEK